MESEGRQITEAVRQMTKLHHDIAALLKTVEQDILSDTEWSVYSVGRAGNIAIAETSSSIGNPGMWMPRYMFRFFVSDVRPQILMFVSVILDGWDHEQEQFKEPLVCAGFFDYGESGRYDNRWRWWYSRIGAWTAWDADYGVVNEVDLAKVPTAKDMKVKRVGLITVPLVSIQTAADLKNNLIDKLITYLEYAPKVISKDELPCVQ